MGVSKQAGREGDPRRGKEGSDQGGGGQGGTKRGEGARLNEAQYEGGHDCQKWKGQV